jgi:hypothetical protein
MADVEIAVNENVTNQEINNNIENENEQEAEENPNRISQWASEVIAFSSQYNDVNYLQLKKKKNNNVKNNIII